MWNLETNTPEIKAPESYKINDSLEIKASEVDELLKELESKGHQDIATKLKTIFDLQKNTVETDVKTDTKAQIEQFKTELSVENLQVIRDTKDKLSENLEKEESGISDGIEDLENWVEDLFWKGKAGKKSKVLAPFKKVAGFFEGIFGKFSALWDSAGKVAEEKGFMSAVWVFLSGIGWIFAFWKGKEKVGKILENTENIAKDLSEKIKSPLLEENIEKSKEFITDEQLKNGLKKIKEEVYPDLNLEDSEIIEKFRRVNLKFHPDKSLKELWEFFDQESFTAGELLTEAAGVGMSGFSYVIALCKEGIIPYEAIIMRPVRAVWDMVGSVFDVCIGMIPWKEINITDVKNKIPIGIGMNFLKDSGVNEKIITFLLLRKGWLVFNFLGEMVYYASLPIGAISQIPEQMNSAKMLMDSNFGRYEALGKDVKKILEKFPSLKESIPTDLLDSLVTSTRKSAVHLEVLSMFDKCENAWELAMKIKNSGNTKIINNAFKTEDGKNLLTHLESEDFQKLSKKDLGKKISSLVDFNFFTTDSSKKELLQKVKSKFSGFWLQSGYVSDMIRSAEERSRLASDLFQESGTFKSLSRTGKRLSLGKNTAEMASDIQKIKYFETTKDFSKWTSDLRYIAAKSPTLLRSTLRHMPMVAALGFAMNSVKNAEDDKYLETAFLNLAFLVPLVGPGCMMWKTWLKKWGEFHTGEVLMTGGFAAVDFYFLLKACRGKNKIAKFTEYMLRPGKEILDLSADSYKFIRHGGHLWKGFTKATLNTFLKADGGFDFAKIGTKARAGWYIALIAIACYGAYKYFNNKDLQKDFEKRYIKKNGSVDEEKMISDIKNGNLPEKENMQELVVKNIIALNQEIDPHSFEIEKKGRNEYSVSGLKSGEVHVKKLKDFFKDTLGKNVAITVSRDFIEWEIKKNIEENISQKLFDTETHKNRMKGIIMWQYGLDKDKFNFSDVYDKILSGVS